MKNQLGMTVTVVVELTPNPDDDSVTTLENYHIMRAIANHSPTIESPSEWEAVYTRAQKLYQRLVMVREERATKAVEYAYKLVKHGDDYFSYQGFNPLVSLG